MLCSRLVSAWLVAFVLALVNVPFARAQVSVDWATPIAITNDPAPTGTSGSYFLDFDPPVISPENRIVALRANVYIPGVGVRPSIWKYASDTSTFELVAKHGDSAPGTGETFAEFSPLLAINGAGTVVFRANLSPSERGSLWVAKHNQSPKLLAIDGGTDPETLLQFTDLQVQQTPGWRLWINGDGKLAFVAGLSDGSTGVWLAWEDGSSFETHLFVRTTELPPVLPDDNAFNTWSVDGIIAVDFNSNGRVAVFGTASGFNGTSIGTYEAIWVGDESDAWIADIATYYVHDIPSLNSFTIYRGPVLDDDDLVYHHFWEYWQDTPDDLYRTWLVVSDDSGISPILSQGGETAPRTGGCSFWGIAPCIGGRCNVIDSLSVPVVAAGVPVFSNAILETQCNTTSGIWFGNNLANLKLYESTTVTGTPLWKGNGSFSSFIRSQMAANDRGRLAFFAGTSRGTGLFAGNIPYCRKHYVFVAGDSIEVAPSTWVTFHDEPRAGSGYALHGNTHDSWRGGHAILDNCGTLVFNTKDNGSIHGVFIYRVPHPGDFNEDGSVNSLDYLAFLNAYNAQEIVADYNCDGQLSSLDITAFLNAWNEDPCY